jgi:CRP/FNR family nitrogen fixation transcriptional regulator
MNSTIRRRGRRSISSSSPSTAGRNPIDWMGSATLFARAEKIFRRGQPAKYIYKVESGSISAYIKLSDGRRLICAFYFPGDYFGLEMRNKHLVSAETIIPSSVRIIDRKRLISRMASDFAAARYMLDITNVELHRAQNIA